jgi:hypothetical protein
MTLSSCPAASRFFSLMSMMPSTGSAKLSSRSCEPRRQPPRRQSELRRLPVRQSLPPNAARSLSPVGSGLKRAILESLQDNLHVFVSTEGGLPALSAELDTDDFVVNLSVPFADRSELLSGMTAVLLADEHDAVHRIGKALVQELRAEKAATQETKRAEKAARAAELPAKHRKVAQPRGV